MSLKKLSKLAVLKFDLTREELPDTLVEELEEMEAWIKTNMTGYLMSAHDGSQLKIDWARGGWSFTISNQPTLKIEGRGKNCLGFLGGELFLLPGRKIYVDDYKIDLEAKEVIFFGSCSTVKDPEGRKLKCMIGFRRFRSKVTRRYGAWSRQIGPHKVMEQMFIWFLVLVFDIFQNQK